ncbi:MAG: large subunit ribosomal protein L44e [Candidatus Woesearchaeota archaeon]|nr:large subunit ribosomal protein L44e [Candidatus Woesearchaeota archaeon]
MKIPKRIKRFCPYCRKHVEVLVIQNKRRKPSPSKKGSKYRARLRGEARGHGNRGRYSKPAVTQFKMTGKKQTKKYDIRYKCTVCNKSFTPSGGKRTKRFEIV